ncbi:MAG: hypothetical protein OEM62_04650 [Acidobacteriota bacterium]|nr:hypothetical protein [Acidobacteriota bacterium]
MRWIGARARKAGTLSLVAAALAVLIFNGCAALIVDDSPGGEKVRVCHKGKKTLEVGEAALEAHLNHGDTPGVCR